MYDLSDEATELPPLHEIVPEDSLLALSWQVGQEGLVTMDAEEAPIPVRYLSMRGLMLDEEGRPAYSQIHVAVPYDAVRPMLEQWLKSMDEPALRLYREDSGSDTPPED